LNTADLSKAMKLGDILPEQLRSIVTTGLQTPRQGILGTYSNERFRMKMRPVGIRLLSFEVVFLGCTLRLNLARSLLICEIELGSAGFVHPDRRAKHLILQD
jgi:hypothetical protein